MKNLIYRILAGTIILSILIIVSLVFIGIASDQGSLQITDQEPAMNSDTYSDETLQKLYAEGKYDELKQALVSAVSDPLTNPFSLYSYSATLFELGNREQAAFVFYLAQVRTRAYTQLDPDPSASGALRGALNDGVGQIINPWVGSDAESWKRIAFAAVAYDQGLGYPAPEFGTPKETWEALIDAERAAYAADMESFLGPLDQATHAIQREQNGLYAGPLQDPGEPLPAAWIEPTYLE